MRCVQGDIWIIAHTLYVIECGIIPLNIQTSMKRPLTVRPYLYGRYILGIFWVYMKVFLTKSKNRKYNVNEYSPNIP